MLTIQGEDQVQLKVTVAEVQRNLVKQLGIDWNALQSRIGRSGRFPRPARSRSPTAATPAAPSPAASRSVGPVSNNIGATIRALEQTGMVRTLAEPTLTAISGESASFLAGGEFPVPTGRDQSGNVTIEFKPFGVALAFTPVVLSDGRISLRVKTEVSELSQEGASRLAASPFPRSRCAAPKPRSSCPPAVRWSWAACSRTASASRSARLPGLGKLPVLGPLFRSRDFQRNETELVIIATPYLVKPVPRTALATPDQGFATPGDTQTNLFGSLNRIYGVKGKPPPPAKKYRGNVGYIFE